MARPAAVLGREALAAGVDTVRLVEIHEQALARVLPRVSSRETDGRTERAANFLLTALAPLADSYRVAVKNNGHLDRMKRSTRLQSAELATTERKLKGAVRRSEAAQAALAESERHYRELLERSRIMQEHLRRLSHEILFAQEEERKRISRELHDEIGQMLTAINVRLGTLKADATVNARSLRENITRTQRLVERSMTTVHRFAQELRPPLLDDLGLIPALRSYMKGFAKRTHLSIQLKVVAAVEKVSAEKRAVLFRVAQEALTNVAKHAHASQVKVTIRRVKGCVHLEVHDNGKSFQVARVMATRKIRRLGLLGMRERVEMVGGSFAIESAPGQGTIVRAQIPIGRGRRGSPVGPVGSRP